MIKLLVGRGCTLICTDKDKNTPIGLAAYNGHVACVEWMIGMGADVRSRNTGGDSPLLLAAMNGHLDVVKVLAGSGVREDLASDMDNSRATAVLHAASAGSTDALQWLLDQGCSLRDADSTGSSAVRRLAHRGSYDLLRLIHPSQPCVRRVNGRAAGGAAWAARSHRVADHSPS